MAPPETALEVDDLLREILLRLPPRPSSLPRASLVCVRWRRIISDPQFLHRFRAHHGKPPLLGFFTLHQRKSFASALDPPDQIPAARFSMPQQCDDNWGFYGCRHGLAVFIGKASDAVIVWDPITGRRRPVPFPQWFPEHRPYQWRNAAVLCDADGAGHVHGDCFLSPFKLVLLRGDDEDEDDDYYEHVCSAYIYDSKYGSWGSSVPTIAIPFGVRASRPSILVQHTLYWELGDGSILELDLQSQCLGVIQNPIEAHIEPCRFRILRTTENRLGVAITTGRRMDLWERKTNDQSVVGWVLEKTVDLDKVLPHGALWPLIQDFIEDTNMILMWTSTGLFTIQLESMKCRYAGRSDSALYYPYTNFYTGLEKVVAKNCDSVSQDHV